MYLPRRNKVRKKVFVIEKQSYAKENNNWKYASELVD